jgi:aquaporin Z
MRKYVVEFIGTFFLVFTIGMCVLKPNDAGAFAPIAIGSVLMVMIYAGGHISGGHFNPAVTLGVFMRGRINRGDALTYMGVQVLAAAAAGVLAQVVKIDPVAPSGAIIPLPAFIAESLFTFALVWVVLNVATSKETEKNSNYGLAIGFTVLVGAFAVGAISRGAFNPAVAAGLVVMKIAPMSDLLIYLPADFLGGAVAAVAFRMLNPEDK